MSLRSKAEENSERVEGDARERTGKGAKEVIRYLTPRLILLFCGYFAGCASLPFGARPFGVAFLAAASGGAAIFTYIGLALSAFLEMEVSEAVVYFGAYTALLLFRALVNFVKNPRKAPLRTEWLLKSAF